MEACPSGAGMHSGLHAPACIPADVATATVWAIHNNTLIRPHHHAPRRSDSWLMRQEHFPNKNAAESNMLRYAAPCQSKGITPCKVALLHNFLFWMLTILHEARNMIPCAASAQVEG